jgi:hypothetical protein
VPHAHAVAADDRGPLPVCRAGDCGAVRPIRCRAGAAPAAACGLALLGVERGSRLGAGGRFGRLAGARAAGAAVAALVADRLGRRDRAAVVQRVVAGAGSSVPGDGAGRGRRQLAGPAGVVRGGRSAGRRTSAGGPALSADLGAAQRAAGSACGGSAAPRAAAGPVVGRVARPRGGSGCRDTPFNGAADRAAGAARCAGHARSAGAAR